MNKREFLKKSIGAIGLVGLASNFGFAERTEPTVAPAHIEEPSVCSDPHWFKAVIVSGATYPYKIVFEDVRDLRATDILMDKNEGVYYVRLVWRRPDNNYVEVVPVNTSMPRPAGLDFIRVRSFHPENKS